MNGHLFFSRVSASDSLPLPKAFPGGINARELVFVHGEYVGYIDRWVIFEDVRDHSAITPEGIQNLIKSETIIAALPGYLRAAFTTLLVFEGILIWLLERRRSKGSDDTGARVR